MPKTAIRLTLDVPGDVVEQGGRSTRPVARGAKMTAIARSRYRSSATRRSNRCQGARDKRRVGRVSAPVGSASSLRLDELERVRVRIAHDDRAHESETRVGKRHDVGDRIAGARGGIGKAIVHGILERAPLIVPSVAAARRRPVVEKLDPWKPARRVQAGDPDARPRDARQSLLLEPRVQAFADDREAK